jgi:hypothetical protein
MTMRLHYVVRANLRVVPYSLLAALHKAEGLEHDCCTCQECRRDGPSSPKIQIATANFCTLSCGLS